MHTTMQVRLEGPRLFPSSGDLDDRILKDLRMVHATIRDRCIIVKYRIDLQGSGAFSPQGVQKVQYGVYIITSGDEKGNRVVRGVRTEQHEGECAGEIATKGARVAILALTGVEPEIVNFNYKVPATW